ncbi:MAG: hypothetical protein ACR2IV_12185 [Bryobacteraceae bacterium]
MATDLETLRIEIQAFLEDVGVAVFHGYRRIVESPAQVYWDTERHEDFREFVEAGRKAGAKLIVFAHEAFSLDEIDEALDQLEDSRLALEEKHTFEKRLHELQAYEGFTCSLELSFDLEGRVYVFELRTAWYQTLRDILAELELSTEQEEDEEQGPMPGYFSRN